MTDIFSRRSSDVILLQVPGDTLQGVDLAGKWLNRADLSGRSVSNARLCDATLREADLRHCDLRAADLSGADLTGADLTGADLSAADLSRCLLQHIRFDETTRWPEGFAPPPLAEQHA